MFNCCGKKPGSIILSGFTGRNKVKIRQSWTNGPQCIVNWSIRISLLSLSTSTEVADGPTKIGKFDIRKTFDSADSASKSFSACPLRPVHRYCFISKFVRYWRWLPCNTQFPFVAQWSSIYTIMVSTTTCP